MFVGAGHAREQKNNRGHGPLLQESGQNNLRRISINELLRIAISLSNPHRHEMLHRYVQLFAVAISRLALIPGNNFFKDGRSFVSAG